MAERKTSELKGILRSSKIEDWEKYSKEFSYSQDWRSYLLDILSLKQIDKKECIKQSGLEVHYAYQMLSGTRNPSRDKLIALCFGGGLNCDEIDRCLEKAGLQPLYPKNLRDSLIICALNSGIRSVLELNIILCENNFEILT